MYGLTRVNPSGSPRAHAGLLVEYAHEVIPIKRFRQVNGPPESPVHIPKLNLPEKAHNVSQSCIGNVIFVIIAKCSRHSLLDNVVISMYFRFLILSCKQDIEIEFN